MASHGAPRREPTGPKSGEAREKELKEIDKYKTLVDQVHDGKIGEKYTSEYLQLTTKLLKENPEYYTVWNYRRQILDKLMLDAATEHSTEDVKPQLVSEMSFLLPLLLQFPKCYWIWNHRFWILEQTSTRLPPQDAIEFWKQELALVVKMLSRDSRNFHGWGYRRKVVQGIRVLNEKLRQKQSAVTGGQKGDNANMETESNLSITEQEFDYTTRMIQSNLSNFSAWHNRSLLIPRLLDERGATSEARKTFYGVELQQIEDAVLLDPSDQSLWYYHEFLMEQVNTKSSSHTFVSFDNNERRKYLQDQIEKIRDVLEDTDDCKWIYLHLLQYGGMYRKLDGDQQLLSPADMKGWLDKVKELDPMRQQRWVDMEKSLEF